MHCFLQPVREVYNLKKCLAAVLQPDEWLLSEGIQGLNDLRLCLSIMSLSDHIYTAVNVHCLYTTLKTEGLIDSETSVNFILKSFVQTLGCHLLNLVSLRVMSSDEIEISSSGNRFFFSLLIAVNSLTFFSHLFQTIESSYWIILSLLWLQAVNLSNQLMHQEGSHRRSDRSSYSCTLSEGSWR